MEFDHIYEAIEHARDTGDPAEFVKYRDQHIAKAADRILPIMQQPLQGDDAFFMLAFGEALIDITKATMNPTEQQLVSAIKHDINLTVVKACIPITPSDDNL